MNIDKIIKNLEIMDKECEKRKTCYNCKFSNLCDQYCNGKTPKDTIYSFKSYFKLLNSLENEELEGDK